MPSSYSFQQIKLTNSFQNKFLLECTKTFETELKRENWKHTLGLHLKDANHSFEKVLETINNALDKHAPYRPMSRKEQKTAKHWITKGIRKSIKIKNYLKKKSCKTKDPTKKAELDAKHKKYKNLLTKLTRKSKDSHYKTFFNENKNSALKIWEGIKKIINIKPTNKSKTINLNINGNLTTDKIKIAKEFNTFFNTIPAKIDSKIVTTNYSFLDTLKNPNINTIFLSPTTMKLKQRLTILMKEKQQVLIAFLQKY